MPYQTGTVTSSADLAAAIQNFAAANGWTLSGGVLSKGGAYIQITAPNAQEVRITGARNGVFSGVDAAPQFSRIMNTSWPPLASYHLAAHTSPDTVWCTINFDTVKHQHMGFGTLAKYGTWAGGMWFHGQHNHLNNDGIVRTHIGGLGTPGSEHECALFWNQRQDIYNHHQFASYLHCELNGNVWEPPPVLANDTHVYCPAVLGEVHRSSPNAFNAQTILTPFLLALKSVDGYYIPVGHAGHLRFCKLTNYAPGDVIQIGPDRWKLFPWWIKDVAYPDGANEPLPRTTGVLGVAVRYDGP